MERADGRKRLHLIDATAQLFRAFYAIRGLTGPDGRPTNAVFGFVSMLRKLLAEERPDLAAAAFDLPGEVFRHATYADYKANRPPTPEDLDAQVPDAKAACELLGVRVVEREGYEADDLIATYARLGREAGLDVVVVASDKDLLQLVRDGVDVLNPSKGVRLDAQGVEREFGVPPARVRDVLALMGDSVDNIPGVPGVGEKTAIALVSAHGDVEAVIARAGCVTALFEARDRLLEALGGSSETVAAAAGSFLETLEAARPGERDAEALSRLDEAAAKVSALLEQGGGERAAKSSLKALDRGSSRRIWGAIHEHAGQARMSRELASLDDRVPVAVDAADLALRPPDRERAHAFFTALGFRTLSAEFAAPPHGEAQASAGTSARGRYETVLDAGRLERIADAARRAGLVAVDTETDSTDPLRARLVGLSLAWEEGAGCYVPVGHRYVGAPGQLPLAEVHALLGPLLADPAVAKVGQNLKYDDHVLRRHGLAVRGWRLDTMVAAFLIESDRSSYGMDKLARDYLGYETIPYAALAGSGASAVTLDRVDVARVTEYAGEDADVTLRLARVLRERLASEGLERLYESIDGPLLPVLARMEVHGIRIDAAQLERMSVEMARAIEEARAEIHTLAGGPFNVDSPKQLREVLFERLELAPRRRTAKSRVASTDARTLEELAGEHAIARRLLDYRELTKLKSTYVDALPRLVHPETGRIHTSFHPTGAATGRISSSDPNLQNIPARTDAGLRIRAAFVPEPGWLFLASDYSQVELRVLAHLSGDPDLAEAFRAGEDIHRFTAARVFGVAPQAVTDSMRRRAKAVNFGILYGMSETRLAREQGMSRAEAARFVETYFSRFARVRDYIAGVRERAQREGRVETLFGRVRSFPALAGRSGRAEREQALRAAVNTTIQGTAADLMKLAMLRTDEALSGSGGRARILLQVHDELLIEAPSDEIDGVRDRVRAAMEGVSDLSVPLVVDQKVGADWRAVT